MVKYLIITMSIVFLSNCSSVWHVGDQYAILDRQKRCSIVHLPYIVDTVGLIASLSLAVSFYTGYIDVSDMPYKDPRAYYGPIFVVSSAFFVSALSGIGKAIDCSR